MADHSAMFRKTDEQSEREKCIERLKNASADLDSLHRITSNAVARADTSDKVDEHALFVAASLLAQHAKELDEIYCVVRD